MKQDNITNLYNAISGKYDLGTENDFRNSLNDAQARKNLYMALRDSYDLGTEEDFNRSLGYGASSPVGGNNGGAATVTQQREQVAGNVTPAAQPNFFRRTVDNIRTALSGTGSVSADGQQVAVGSQQAPTKEDSRKAFYENRFIPSSVKKGVAEMVGDEPYVSEGERKTLSDEIRTRLMARATPEQRREMLEQQYGDEINKEFDKQLAEHFDEQDIARRKSQVDKMRQEYLKENLDYLDEQYQPELENVRQIEKEEEEQRDAEKEAFLREHPQYDKSRYADIEEKYNRPLEEGESAELRQEFKRLAKEERYGELKKEEALVRQTNAEIEEKRLQRRLDEAEQRRKESAPLGDFRGFIPSEEEEVLQSALRQRQKEIRIIQAERDDAGFLQGIADAAVDPSFWTLGLSDVSTALRLNDIKNDIESGKELTESQKMLLDATVGVQEAEGMYSNNRGFWYNAANVTVNAVPFVGEFILTGGGYNVISGAFKAGGKALAKNVTNRLANAIIRYTGTALGDVASALTMTATTGGARTLADIEQRYLGQVEKTDDGYMFVGGEDWGDAITDGLVANTLEYYAEKLGGHLDLVGHGISRLAGRAGRKLGIDKGIEKLGLSKLSPVLTRIKGSDFFQQGNALLRKGGVHELPSEVLEEEANILLNAALVGDNQFSDLWDAKTQLDLVGGLAVSIGFMRALPIAGGVYKAGQYYRYKHATDVADTVANYRLTEEKWAPLKEQIDNATNEEFGGVLQSVIDNPSLEDQEKEAVADYAIKLLKMRGYNLGTIADAKDRIARANDAEPDETVADAANDGVERGYQEGYQTANAAARKQYADEADAAAEQVRELFDEDDQQRIFGDDYTADYNTNYYLAHRDEYTDEQIMAAVDYYQKRARVEGMMDGAENAADLQVQQENAKVRSNTHQGTGQVITATRGGEQFYVVGGDIVTDPETGLDTLAGTGGAVVVKNTQTGEVKVLSPQELSIQSVQDAQQLIDYNENELRQQLMQQAENDMTYGEPANEVFMQDDEVQLKDADRNIIIGTIGMLPDTADGKFIVQTTDGQALPFTEEELNRMVVSHNGQEISHGLSQTATEKGMGHGLSQTNTEEDASAEQEQSGNLDNAGGEASVGNGTGANNPSASAPSTPSADEAGTVEDSMPMIGEGEDAEPDFTKATSERAHRYIYNEAGLTREESDQFVDANKKEADKALEKLTSKPPKMGPSLAKYRKEKAEWQASIDAAQQRASYWQEVKDRQTAIAKAEQEAAFEEQQREAEGRRQLLEDQRTQREKMQTAKRIYGDYLDDDLETPHDVMELVALNMPRNLAWDDTTRGEHTYRGLQSELGTKRGWGQRGDTTAFNPYLAAKGKGVGIDEAVHAIWESSMNSMANGEKRFDDTEIKNALLDLLSSAQTPADIRDYVVNNRVAQAEAVRAAEDEAAKDAEMQAWAEHYHLTPEEREAFEDFMSTEPPYTVEENIINQIIADNEQNRTSTRLDSADVPGGNAAGIEGGESQVQGTVEAANHGNHEEGTSEGAETATVEPVAVGDNVSGGARGVVIPIGTGDFGPIYDQFRGKPKEAIDFLSKQHSGEAIGALSHKDVGEIDLVWGEEGTGHSDGYGLAKLLKYHPEVLDDLQGILDEMTVTSRSDNRVNLESKKYKAAVRLTWNEKSKTWLLTVFEKKNSALDNTTDTGKTSERGKRNDTATPQSTVSEGKVTEKISNEQENLGKTSTAEEISAEKAKVNTNPTEGQKEAGNYQMGHINIDGYDITIENPKGSVRRGVDASGKAWEQEMHNTYGYIRETEGVDGDHIDVFISETPTSGNVYVVDQINKDGTFDEHKVMYGFASEEEAKAAYLSNYNEGWQGLGAITEVSREEFKKWVNSSHRKTKPFAEYKSVKKEQSKSEKQHKRIVSDDQMEELRKKLLEKFNNLNAGIDVERMLLGAMYAVGKIERGVTKFADYAAEMVSEIGDAIRPYLKAFYEAVRNMPEAAEYRDQMTSPEEVAAFDEYNFDKKQKTPDAITKAEQVVKKQKAKQQVKKIEKEVKLKIQQGDLFAGDLFGEEAAVVQQQTEQPKPKDAKGKTAWWNDPNRPKNLDPKDYKTYTTDEAKAYFAQFKSKDGKTDFTKWAHPDLAYITAAAWDGANIPVEELMQVPEIQKAEGRRNKKGSLNINEEEQQQHVAHLLDAEHGSAVYVSGKKRGYSGPVRQERKALIVIGLPAGGKSSVFADPLSYQYGARIIDSDIVKPWLEGYDEGYGAGYVQNASADIAAKAMFEAAERGDNMVIPRIGGNSVIYDTVIPLREMGYDVQLIFNDVLEQSSIMRAASRFAQEGRYLSLDYLTKIKGKPSEFFSTFVSKTIGEYFDERTEGELQNIRGRFQRLFGELDGTRAGLRLLSSSQRRGEGATEGAVPSSLGGQGVQDGRDGVSLLGEPLFSYAEWKSNDVGFGEKPKEIWNSKSGKPMPANDNNNEGEQKISGKPSSSGEGTEQASRPAERAGAERGSEQNRAERSGSGRSIEEVATESQHTKQPAKPKQELQKNKRNNQGERGKDYAPTSPKARFNANVEAIRLMRQLMDDGVEAPTKEQMEVLRKYSGWGGLGTYFNDEGLSENKLLRELLTEEEYNDAVMSINSAYYTPAMVIDTLWDVAKAMGFKGGNVLEGSAGIGNIIGQMPQDMSRNSDIKAVEIDTVSGNILRLLYPDATVYIQGFQDTVIPNGSVDLAITNVPFVTGLHVIDKVDRDLSRKFTNIHDFCIAKNIRKLREGGIGIFITSSGTMDKSNELRAWITDEGGADIVGAFRLNNETFGGTKVTSDIVVVRKRIGGRDTTTYPTIDVSAASPLRVGTWTDKFGDDHQVTMVVNDYFKEHPEMMAGKMYFGYEKGETFRPGSYGLYPEAGMNQEQMLQDFAKEMEKAKSVATESQQTEQEPETNQLTAVKEGRMLVDDKGRLCVSQRGVAVPLGLNEQKVKGYSKKQCFEDYQSVQKAVDDALQQQLNDPDDAALRPKLDALNKAFDTFVKRYGNLHKNTAIAFLRNDIDFPSFLALENYSETKDIKGKVTVITSKTPLFKQRVLGFKTEPQPKTVKDAVIASVFRSNGIDLEWIAKKLSEVAAPPNGDNWTADDVKKGILVSRLGFEDPSTGQLVVRYKYLSGNVREKLAIAEAYNTDGKYSANIEELRKVVPMDIPAHLIDFSLGSSWIPVELYKDYLKENYDLDNVKLNHLEGSWMIGEGYGFRNEKNRSAGVYSEKFRETIYGHELVAAALNNRPVKVAKQVTEGYGSSKTTRTVVDQAATQACAVRVDEIKEEFKQWTKKKMQDDPELARSIEKIYNEKFNALVPMEIGDEFLPEHFDGSNVNISLYGHQKRGVMRGVTAPTMLAHEVGTGKSFTLISTAMEMRRLGTAKKPMIVVQNATVAQMTSDAKVLYPNAKVLSLSEKDRDAEGRRNFYAKIKYNDWDIIIVPQSTFERIPDSPERELQFIQEKIDEKKHVIEAAEQSGADSRELQKLKKELEKIEQEYGDKFLDSDPSNGGDSVATNGTGKRKKDAKREAAALDKAATRAAEQLDRAVDDVQYFDDLGVDALLVDEAHEYKHLGFQTSIGRGIKGIDPSYSKKCAGLYNKTRSVFEQAGWKNVVFATGTPISNTAAEIWTFMKYLMPPDVMKANDIYYFDDFVHNFGNIAQSLEFQTNGKFREVTRFSAYVNKPELIRIWSQVADTVLTKEVGKVQERIPDEEGGKDQDIFLPQSPSLVRIMAAVRAELERFENMTGPEKKENSSIPLTMYGIAKRAAIDPRLVDAEAPDEPMSKTNAAVKEIVADLKKTEAYKGTVAVFCDNQNRLGRNGDAAKSTVEFNIYEDMRDKLIKAGVPESQIAIIKSGMSITAKQKIFDAVNNGDIRVVLGSTQTLGTGVNMQERLHLLIHMDAPDRPMDYTQRNGRIKRQGNLHKQWGKTIRVIRFGVEDSLDVTAYQRLKTKSGFIDSIMDGKSALQNNQVDRTVEEEEEGLFDNPVAILSGSQYALKKNQAERELRKYQGKKAQWAADQVYVANALRRNAGLVASAEANIKKEEEQLEHIKSLFPDGKVKTITVEGVPVDMSSGGTAAYGELAKLVKEKISDPVNTIVKRNRENAIYNDETLKFTVELDGHPVYFTVQVARESVYENGKMRTVIHKYTSYSSQDLRSESMTSASWGVKDFLDEILEQVVTGQENKDRIAAYKASIERINAETKQLQQRVGMEFQYEKELEDAKKHVDEYTELMKQEMAEKEAKYAAQQEADADASGTGAFNLKQAEESEEKEELYRADEDEEPTFRDVETFEEGDAFPIHTTYGYGKDVLSRNKTYSIDLLVDEFGSVESLLDALRVAYPGYFIQIVDGKATFESWDAVMKETRAARTAKQVRGTESFFERKTRNAINAVKDLAGRMGLDVDVLTSTEGLEGKKARAKGFFNPKTGKITIVLPNHTNQSDLVKTLLHEGVAHYGLRKMFGEHFDTFLDNIYNNVDAQVRARIDAAMKRNGWSRHVATEEYLARLAEQTSFENALTSGWWQKIKDFFLRMLAEVGLVMREPLTDNELRYILWRSYENLLHPDKRRNIFDKAREVDMQSRLGVRREVLADASVQGRAAAQTEQTERTAKKTAEVVSMYSPMVQMHNELKEEYPGALFIFKMPDGSYRAVGDSVEAVGSAFGRGAWGNDVNGNEYNIPEAKIDMVLPRLIRQGYRIGIVDAPKEDVASEGNDVSWYGGELLNSDIKNIPSQELLLSLQEKEGDERNETINELVRRVREGEARIVRMGQEMELDRGNDAEIAGAIIGGWELGLSSLADGTLRGVVQGRSEMVQGSGAQGTHPDSDREIPIISWAKSTGHYYDEDEVKRSSLDKGVWLSGAQSNVYRTDDGKKVIKFMESWVYYQNPLLKHIDGIVLQNNAGFDHSTVLGYSLDEKGRLLIVLEQDYVDGVTIDDVFEDDGPARVNSYIDNYLEKVLGLEKGGRDDDGNPLHKKDGLIYKDIHGANVLMDRSGKLHIIDGLVEREGDSGKERGKGFSIEDEEELFRADEDEREDIHTISETINEYNRSLMKPDEKANWLQQLMRREWRKYNGGRLREAWQDSMLALKRGQDIIVKHSGTPLKDYEDAYSLENLSHGRAKNEYEWFDRNLYKPMLKAFWRLQKALGVKEEDVHKYLFCKHGLERNVEMAFRDAVNKEVTAAQKKYQKELKEWEAEDDPQPTEKPEEPKGVLEIHKEYREDPERIANEEAWKDGSIDYQTYRAVDDEIRKKYAPDYPKFRKRDYAGLTGLFATEHEESDGTKVTDYPSIEDAEKSALAKVDAVENRQLLRHSRNARNVTAKELCDDLWKRINACTKWTLLKSYQSGQMNKAVYEYVKGMYEHYIPLRGWDGTNAQDVYDYVGSRAGVFSNNTIPAKGRTSVADNPIAYIGNMAMSGIVIGQKQMVKQRLLNLARNHRTDLLGVQGAWYQNMGTDEDPLWQAVTPDIPEDATAQEVADIIDAFERRMEALKKEGRATQDRAQLNIVYPAPSSQLKEHEIHVTENGKEYIIYVNGDPRLAQAVNGTRARKSQEGHTGFINELAARSGRFKAAIYTSFSPAFIVTNWTRDISMAIASSLISKGIVYNARAARNTAALLNPLNKNNIFHLMWLYTHDKLDMRSSTQRMFKEFMTEGAETGFIAQLDLESFKKGINKELGKQNQVIVNPKRIFRGYLQTTEFLNRCIEDSTRFIVYKTSREKGQSAMKAASEAKNVTLNFNRKGTGELGNAFARGAFIFVNPAIQGIQTLFRLAKGHPFKFTAVTAGWVLGGALMPYINAMLMQLFGPGDDGDEEAYWKLPEHVRRQCLCVYVGDGDFITIPLAQEFRTFWGIGEQAAARTLGHGKEDLKDEGLDIVESFLDLLPMDLMGHGVRDAKWLSHDWWVGMGLNFTPDLIKTELESLANKDFTGKPVYRSNEWNKHLPEWTKSFKGTPEWLTRSAQLLNTLTGGEGSWKAGWADVNPSVLDHELRGWVGGPFNFGSGVLSTAAKLFNGEDVKVYDVPVLNRLLNSPSERETKDGLPQSYWKMYAEEWKPLEQTVSEMKKQAKAGNWQALDALEQFYLSDEYQRYADMKAQVEAAKLQRESQASGDGFEASEAQRQDTPDARYNALRNGKDAFEDWCVDEIGEQTLKYKKELEAMASQHRGQEVSDYRAEHSLELEARSVIERSRARWNQYKRFLGHNDAMDEQMMKKIRSERDELLRVYRFDDIFKDK